MNVEKLEFGEFVRNMRIASGLSVRELGVRLNRSRATMHNYENGSQMPFNIEEFEAQLRQVVKAEIIRRRDSHELECV